MITLGNSAARFRSHLRVIRSTLSFPRDNHVVVVVAGNVATRRSFSFDSEKKRRANPNQGRLRDGTPAPRRAVYQEVREVLRKSREESSRIRGTSKAMRAPASPVERILAGSSSMTAPTSREEILLYDRAETTESQLFPMVENTLNSHRDLINFIASRKSFTREHTKNPVPPQVVQSVVEYLTLEEPLDIPIEIPTLKQALNNKSSDVQLTKSTGDTAKQLRLEILRQRESFLIQKGWNDRQFQFLDASLNQAVNMSARNAFGNSVEIIWRKVKEAGIINKNLLQTLLHVASTFAKGNSRKRALYGKYSGGSILHILEAARDDQEDLSDDDLTDIIDEIAIYHDLNFQPTEQSLLVRSRLLIAQGRAKDAEDLLVAHRDNTTLHLRSYLPVLRMYLENRELGPALRVYRRMSDDLSHKVQGCLDAVTYVSLIAGIAECGAFDPSAPPIETATSCGFTFSSGPGLLDELLTEMKENIVEIPLSLARRLHNAFADGFPGSNLEILPSLAPLGIREDEVQPHERLLADLVPVDPSTGKCRRTGVTLRLEHLTAKQAEQLKEGVLSLADGRREDLIEKISKFKPQARLGNAAKELQSFFRWLDVREGEPFTVILDGANIGYYMQNFETGRFSFHQIQFVIDSLESLGERPLVVLPRKYTLDFFSIAVGSFSGIGSTKQRLTSAEKRIRTALMDSGKIAVVPPGFLDDYYWILASISQQMTSRKNMDLTVRPDDPSGRWPGTRPVLITNDQMRDHRLSMLEPMIFRRWYSNYIVNYNFPAFVGSECSHREIGFSPADFFSHEIQANQMPDGSNVWHFPVSDQQDVWFCLSIRNNQTASTQD